MVETVLQISRYSPGRPVKATDDENVTNVKRVLDTDRRLTCDELDYDLGIIHDSIYTILRNKLNMRRLTFDTALLFSRPEKSARPCGTNILGRFENEGENVLNRIITITENLDQEL